MSNNGIFSLAVVAVAIQCDFGDGSRNTDKADGETETVRLPGNKLPAASRRSGRSQRRCVHAWRGKAGQQPSTYPVIARVVGFAKHLLLGSDLGRMEALKQVRNTIGL